MSKRSRSHEESNLSASEGRRYPKRLKPSPASPASHQPTADSLLDALVVSLLDDIKELPPGLAMKGFDRALQEILKKEFFARPLIYDYILRGIGMQTNALTEVKDAEAKYIFLIDGMITRLNGKLKHLHNHQRTAHDCNAELKDLLPAAHEAARTAREQAAMPPPPSAMPIPSAFAQASEWSKAQEGPDAILCLRPRKSKASLLSPCMTLFATLLMSQKIGFLPRNGCPQGRVPIVQHNGRTLRR